MRLHLKLLVLFGILFAIALSARTFFTYRLQREHLDDINADIRNVTTVVHFATQRLASEKERDRNALNKFITDAVAQHRALKEISIVNINQEIIASSDPHKIGKVHHEIWRDMLIEGELHSGDSLNWYKITIPIIKDQKVIGQVLASVKLTDTADVYRDLNLRDLIISLTLFIAISIVSFLMLKGMTRPLRSLQMAAGRIASGELDVQMEASGSDECSQLAAAFCSMAARLRQLRTYEEQLRDMERHAILSETAATLAHEIRNPLNFVNLTAGRLAHRFKPADDDRRTEYLDLIGEIKSQVQYINGMVNDFLAAGRPLKLKYSSFTLSELFEQVGMVLKQQMVDRGITIDSRIDPQTGCYADIEQLRLVLINLVHNAVEMAPQGSAIVLEAVLQADTVVIKVSDQGPGIPQESLERIFDPYYTRRPGGTGLGLTLCRRVVEAHLGTIRVENLPQGGACFTLTLPRRVNDTDIDC